MLGHKYTWVAQYNDSSKLEQIEASGKKNAYENIDMRKLSAFELYEGSSRIAKITFKQGQKLIWRRRVDMSPGSNINECCHIIGKKEVIDGVKHEEVVAIFESDGRMEILGTFKENHPWLYPPELLPHEDYGDQL